MPVHLKAGHVPPPYARDAKDRLFRLWGELIAAQNYPAGTDAHLGHEAEAACRRFFPQPSKLLFLGCGDGTEMVRCQTLGHEVWGVTLNPNNVEFAKGTLDLENVFFMDSHVLPAEWGASFDGAVGNHFLEHSPAPVLQLLEVWRVLRPGGLCYFETPGPFKWTTDENPHHYTCPIPVQARGWLLKAGFVEVEAKVKNEGGVPDPEGPHDYICHFWGRRPR